MAKNMSKAGYSQGNMSPIVEDYQTPRSTFSQEQFGTTTNYVERTNATMTKAASKIRANGYKGRYS